MHETCCECKSCNLCKSTISENADHLRQYVDSSLTAFMKAVKKEAFHV